LNQSHKKLFLKASLIISFAVILSRVLGMVREQYSLYLFGAGWELDAFISASKIPNAFRNLLGEGAFSAVFVSLFASIASKNRENGIRFANQVSSFLFIISLILTGIGIFFAPEYLSLIHKNPSTLHTVVILTYYMMPFLVFISLSGIIMGILNTWENYFTPAISQFFGNIAFLVFLFFFQDKLGIDSLAIAFLISSAVSFVIQFPSLWRKKYSFRFNFKIDDNIKIFFKSFFPVAFSMAVFQINRIVSNIFSSSIEGGNTVFEKAFIVIQLVLSVFISGISTVVLPAIAKENKKNIEIIYTDSLRFIFLILFPFTLLFLQLGHEISSFIYKDILVFLGIGSGKVSAKAVQDIGLILVYFSPGILFFGLLTIVNRGFQGLKLFYYPLAGSIISLLINYFFMKFQIDSMGIKAIPIAITIATLANVLIAFLLFQRKNKMHYKSFFLSVSKSIIAGSAFFFTIEILKNISLSNIYRLPLLTAAGFLVYFSFLFLLNEKEIRNLFYSLLKRLKLFQKTKQVK